MAFHPGYTRYSSGLATTRVAIWMDLQKDYELRTAEAALGDVLKSIRHRPKRRAD